jgi:hypothetical protein
MFVMMYGSDEMGYHVEGGRETGEQRVLERIYHARIHASLESE